MNLLARLRVAWQVAARGFIDKLDGLVDVFEIDDDRHPLDDDPDLGKPELCPDCAEPIVQMMSGVKCSACDWWFCY